MNVLLPSIELQPHPEPDLEQMRADKVREIALAAISAAFQGAIVQPLCSGDEISVQVRDETVRARAFFDRSHLEVQMIEPFPLSTGWLLLVSARTLHYCPGRSLLSDSPDPRAATSKCLEKVISLLQGLYCDWFLMKLNGEAIQEKYARYLKEEQDTRSRDEILNRPILEEIDALRKEKRMLKQRFKNKEMREWKYKARRKSLVSAISAKKALLFAEDVFGRIYGDELRLLRCVDNPRELIRSVANSDIP